MEKQQTTAELLQECKLQLEYLNEKFGETGTTNALLTKIDVILQQPFETIKKQQTAVEWIIEQIETKNGKEFSSYYTEFIDQALAMEKKQTIDFADIYAFIICGYDFEDAEQYYNEVYGGGQDGK